MDNPHMQSELSYLAGVIDGEGTITLERSGKRRLCGVMGLSPMIIIANTNRDLIQYCINIISKFGINPYIKTQDSGRYGRGKAMYWICIKGFTKCKKILSSIKKYLVAKYAQANLLIEFIDYRGDSQEAKGKPYGEVELGILEKIRSLNRRGVTETEDHGLRKFNFPSQMTVQPDIKVSE